MKRPNTPDDQFCVIYVMILGVETGPHGGKPLHKPDYARCHRGVKEILTVRRSTTVVYHRPRTTLEYITLTSVLLLGKYCLVSMSSADRARNDEASNSDCLSSGKRRKRQQSRSDSSDSDNSSGRRQRHRRHRDRERSHSSTRKKHHRHSSKTLKARKKKRHHDEEDKSTADSSSVDSNSSYSHDRHRKKRKLKKRTEKKHRSKKKSK